MAVTQETIRSHIIPVSEIAWQDMQPGVRTKLLWSDAATNRQALMVHIAPGVELPMHRHVGDELIYLIEGANADEAGIVHTGNMNYRPNGCAHTVTTENGATVLAVVWGHTEPV